ncbi:MAG: hypothetical protein WBL65_16310 [Bryobacteraceae bacterium]
MDLPAELKVRDIVTTIAYGRMRIGSSEPLSPHSPEVTVTDSPGGQQARDRRWIGKTKGKLKHAPRPRRFR